MNIIRLLSVSHVKTTNYNEADIYWELLFKMEMRKHCFYNVTDKLINYPGSNSIVDCPFVPFPITVSLLSFFYVKRLAPEYSKNLLPSLKKINKFNLTLIKKLVVVNNYLNRT